MGNTFTLLIIFIAKSLQKSKIAQIYYYEPQSAGRNVQSPQSKSTPRRLTLLLMLMVSLLTLTYSIIAPTLL